MSLEQVLYEEVAKMFREEATCFGDLTESVVADAVHLVVTETREHTVRQIKSLPWWKRLLNWYYR